MRSRDHAANGPGGGAVKACTGWRSIFLVNIPFCLLTGWLLVRYVTELPPDISRRTDIPGLLLGVVALGALTGGFIEAGQRGWLAPLPVALIAAGAIAGVLFVCAERRRADPMLPLRRPCTEGPVRYQPWPGIIATARPCRPRRWGRAGRRSRGSGWG